jgi:hypothetical protein
VLDPNFLHGILLSNTLSLCSSFDAEDQVSHPYGNTGKIAVLLLILDSKREDKDFELNGSKGFPIFNMLLISS